MPGTAELINVNNPTLLHRSLKAKSLFAQLRNNTTENKQSSKFIYLHMKTRSCLPMGFTDISFKLFKTPNWFGPLTNPWGSRVPTINPREKCLKSPQ